MSIHLINFISNLYRCPGRQLVPFLEDPLLGPDTESEDCLTINVWRPKGHSASGKKLPVSVLIPGGAFNRGAARMHNTHTMLAFSPEPFVAVSMQYRIGVFGGFNNDLTQKEGVLNLGLKDMYVALEWVQKNIAAFGGDADDVTIMGLSAAAHAVSQQLQNEMFTNCSDWSSCYGYQTTQEAIPQSHYGFWRPYSSSDPSSLCRTQ